MVPPHRAPGRQPATQRGKWGTPPAGQRPHLRNRLERQQAGARLQGAGHHEHLRAGRGGWVGGVGASAACVHATSSPGGASGPPPGGQQACSRVAASDGATATTSLQLALQHQPSNPQWQMQQRVVAAAAAAAPHLVVERLPQRVAAGRHAQLRHRRHHGTAKGVQHRRCVGPAVRGLAVQAGLAQLQRGLQRNGAVCGHAGGGAQPGRERPGVLPRAHRWAAGDGAAGRGA